MIESRVNGDDHIGVDTRYQAHQAITNERSGDGLHSRNALRLVAQVKKTPIELRVIADSWPVKLYSLTQRETTILLKYIDNFNAIARRGWCVLLLFSGTLLSCQTFLLLLLGDEGFCIVNTVFVTLSGCPPIFDKVK